MAKKKGKPFDQTEVDKALDELQKYIEGKYSIDQKATTNQEWWRLRNADERAYEEDGSTRSRSAWAVNSILNKHADIMDSFPKPNILPREADDENEAKSLSEIVPVLLEQNNYESGYNQMGWDFCVDGGAITSVLWDPSKCDGMGDISYSNVDVHNLFWEPGVNNLQKSRKVFHVTLEDVDVLKSMYPDIADEIGPQDTAKITKYLHDDNIDVSNCAEVINMYYKKTEGLPVFMDGEDEEGNPTKVQIHTVQKTYLHLAIIINDTLAFCSENETGYEKGYYHHGRYPFVIRRAFPIKDTPWGFGYLDIMKNPQMYIDEMDEDIITVADMKARPRWWVRKNAGIDLEGFTDWSKRLVEVGTNDIGDAIRPMDVPDVPSGIMQHKINKIEELKETSGNRDFSQGSTASGVTAASAIAALQEAGSKLSRDINKALYRGAREEYYLVIELIRQFYIEPRSFRTSGSADRFKYTMYSNANIKEDALQPDGTIRHRKPIFDIMVTAEKQSPFSRAAQNETAKELYSMGMFNPENAIPALACLDMMDFEGKDKLVQRIEENGTMIQQFNAAMSLIQQLAMGNDTIAAMAMQMGLLSPEQMADMQTMAMHDRSAQRPMPSESPEERVQSTGNSYADKIRARSANAASPM